LPYNENDFHFQYKIQDMQMKKLIFYFLLVLTILSLTACAGSASRPKLSEGAASNSLNVVATTTIVGDVVRSIGGDAIHLVVLLAPGMDPHSFQPTPQDVAKVSDADLIFINGAGLESFMNSLLTSSGDGAKVVAVSDGIQLLNAPEGEIGAQADAAGDPHVWMDPNNVIVWVDNIERALSEADPANSALYAQNAAQYRQMLVELDQWVSERIAELPASKRTLVTDHQIFGYFAERYGFTQVGTLIPGYSTMAEPSAQELATLETAIGNLNVPAIFVGDTVNPSMAERVSADTNTRLVFVYTGSLTKAGGPASTYPDFIRYDVNAIVDALK
jgi:manganese/iron transport system substrate-binding protein